MAPQPRLNVKPFDPVAWTLDRQRQAPLKLTFQATNRKQAEVWQRQFRAKVVELVGGFPDARPPLKPQTLEIREFSGYKREKLIFESRPGVGVLGIFIDTNCLHCTVCNSRMQSRPRPRCRRHCRYRRTRQRSHRQRLDTAYDFAIQVAEHGMAAVAIEPMAFGCRRDAKTSARWTGDVGLRASRWFGAASRRDHDRLARLRCDAHH